MMDGRRIPIFDDRNRITLLNEAGALRQYVGQMVVHDPGELHDYARHLWEQWQTGSRLYTRHEFKQAAAWLLEMYVEAGAPQPTELLQVCGAILAADIAPDKEDGSNLPKGALLSHERLAATFEASARFEATRPSATPPSVTEVAHHLIDNFGAGSEQSEPHVRVRHVESNVSRWRRDQRYKEAVASYRRAVFGPPEQ